MASAGGAIRVAWHGSTCNIHPVVTAIGLKTDQPAEPVIFSELASWRGEVPRQSARDDGRHEAEGRSISLDGLALPLTAYLPCCI